MSGIRQSGATRPWAKSTSPETYDFAAAVSVATACTTIGLGTVASSQVGTLIIQNMGTVDCYVSPKPTMTTSDSICLAGVAGSATTGGSLEISSGCEWYARSASGTGNLRVLRTKFV
jgi:hypothetical protein